MFRVHFVCGVGENESSRQMRVASRIYGGEWCLCCESNGLRVDLYGFSLRAGFITTSFDFAWMADGRRSMEVIFTTPSHPLLSSLRRIPIPLRSMFSAPRPFEAILPFSIFISRNSIYTCSMGSRCYMCSSVHQPWPLFATSEGCTRCASCSTIAPFTVASQIGQ